MSSENFTNFATSTLNGSITATSATFAVAGGQGSLFPSANFVVTIDTEIIFVSSRSSDTFTISGGRGFNSSVAASHSNGATVQLTICAYNLQHLWQNVADTYTPEVPPVQVSVTPSVYDNEFESLGSSWTLYPSAGGGTTFNAGTSLRSFLLLYRSSPDNTAYYAYVPFVPGGGTAWTATCRVSQATTAQGNGQDQAQIDFFASDQVNPTTGPDTGNRFKINTALTTNGNYMLRFVRDTSGSASFVGPAGSGFFISSDTLYLRISCDGSGGYGAYWSHDGITYWSAANLAGLNSSIQTLGFCFHNYNPSGQWVPHQAAIDYVRVVVGSAQPPYGS